MIGLGSLIFWDVGHLLGEGGRQEQVLGLAGRGVEPAGGTRVRV